jgi:hypothetical protein
MGYNKYKAGVNKFGEMLPCFLFQRKSVSKRRKFSFISLISLWQMHSKKNRNLFYELVAEGLLSDVGQDIQEWTRCTSTGKLTGRDHCP